MLVFVMIIIYKYVGVIIRIYNYPLM